MVIYGEYSSDQFQTPSPYVEAYVFIPQLSIQGRVKFLVDSGANGVALNADDVKKMEIPQNLLPEAGVLQQYIGIGGTQNYYSVPATLAFETAPSQYIRCRLNISIAGDPHAPQGIPSLLGRDFLNLCDLRLNHAQNLVSLTPLNIDPGGIILPP